jgi:radical SAM superfamily enzyme YgiQ (UPF0313 family)
VSEYGVDGISFLDENFFVNRKWAWELGDRLPVPWIAATHIEYVDEEFVRRVEKSKCAGIAFGLESGSDRVLGLMGKKTTKEGIRKKAGLFARVKGLKFSACVIFGYPTETHEEFKETLGLMMDLLGKMPKMTFACGGFLAFPGCGAWDLALEGGFEAPERLEDWREFDRWSSYEWMVKYVVAVQAVSKRWAWAGRQVGRLVRQGTRSAIMDGLVQAREQGGKCKSWLGKFAKWL